LTTSKQTIILNIESLWTLLRILGIVRSSETFSSRAKVNSNIVSTPGVEETVIFPPNLLMIFLEIWSPRPMPFTFIYWVFSKNPKSLNNLGMSYSLIPTPLSFTSI